MNRTPRQSKASREVSFSLVLLSLANARRDQAVEAMADQVNGYSGGGGGGRASGHSDPTALLAGGAIDEPKRRTDKARSAIDEEADLRRQLTHLADRYANLIAGWAQAEVADAKAQQETAEDNTPRCEPCAAEGFSTPHHRRTDMGGRLGYRMWLCGWHIKQVRKNGHLPTKLEVHDHHGNRERLTA